MVIWETLIVAFSMFSAIPVPQIAWNERNMRYSLCAFPLVGAMIGLLCCGWIWLCGALAAPAVLRGAGLCLIPVLVTGGIHLDGYADTCDALACHGGPEQRQQILKDPHLGAFAAIRLCVFFLAMFALCTSLDGLPLSAALGLFGLSRCLSALALTAFPLRKGSGLARTFADAADKARVRRMLIPMAACCVVLLSIGRGLLAAVAAGFVFLYYRRLCSKQFEGLSGDLAGWFLQTAEIWMVGMLVLEQLIRGVIA